MDSSSAQHHHHQEMSSQTLESMLVCTKAQQEKKPRPAEQALKCPRCDSTNTKFCYYNNYSLSQPRYFCKSCRRYWTKGGTLRNVPVGGGCRKNKRSSSSSSSSSSSKRGHDHHQAVVATSTTNPLLLSSVLNTTPLSYDSDHISLAIARLQKQTSGQQLQGFDHDSDHLSMLGTTNPNNPHCGSHDILGGVNTATPAAGLFDALKGGFLESSTSGFHSLYYGMNNGQIEHIENGGGSGGGLGIGIHVSEEMTLPYEDLGVSTTTAAVAAVKQEMCNGTRDGESNRVLWGFPWQFSGGGEGTLGDLDHSGRQSWNGFGSTSWHGLLNSPLM